ALLLLPSHAGRSGRAAGPDTGRGAGPPPHHRRVPWLRRAALLSPGAALVPATACPGERRLQLPGVLPCVRAAQCRRTGEEPAGARLPSRVPANPLLRGRWPAHAGDRGAPAVAPRARRSAGPAARGAAAGSPATRGG